MTLALAKAYVATGREQTVFTDDEIRIIYMQGVRDMIDYLGHNLHIGGKYWDAYSSRNLPKYGVLKTIGNKIYEFTSEYRNHSDMLIQWIPARVKEHITERLGIVPQLANREFRVEISSGDGFLDLLTGQLNRNPTNFEIFSFAVLKVHLEKFACKIYRDTRTSAHDKGVDLSTNFGVVYQIKKLQLYNRSTADDIYSELKLNFDSDRISDGKVVLVIDDISKEIKNYLLNMKVQSISKRDVLILASQFEDIEDREKVLRVVYEEFKREYGSDIN
jgi:hypothetical protein